MSAPSWTPAQRAAIDARSQNLLVNAGAGAGKTATLVERVFRLITEPGTQVTLDSLLIVTFTRAAAAEMRERLARKLRDELSLAQNSNAPLEHVRKLRSELLILPRAPISTLHSFCLSLLREHGAALGLAPDFDLMAEEEATLLRRELIEDAIESELAAGGPESALADVLHQLPPADGVPMLVQLAMRWHSFLESLAAPEEWIRATVLPLYEELAGDKAFFETAGGARLRARFMEPSRRALDAINVFLGAWDEPDQNRGQAIDFHRGVLDAATRISTFLRISDESALVPIASELFFLRRRPAVREGSADNEYSVDARLLKETIKECAADYPSLKEAVTWRAMREQLISTIPIVKLFTDQLGLGLSEEILEHHLAQRRLTFAHLERLARHLLVDDKGGPTPPALALRERFAEILVDEFQDVNELQASLLRAVARPPEDLRGGNLFVVGDVKQSIYGFRQADPRQFLSLFHAYHAYDAAKPATPGARINLLENFRSQPSLLVELNSIFRLLFSETIGGINYDAAHEFVPGLPDGGLAKPALEFHFLDEDAEEEEGIEDGPETLEDLTKCEAEAAYVARLIRNLGVPLRDVVVLLRTARGYATTLLDALRREALPSYTQESIGFLEQQEVRDVLSILQTIDNPFHDVALVGALRGPAGNWNEDDLAALRLHDRQGRLFDNLKLLAAGAGGALHEKCRAFLEQLNAWRHHAARENMGDLFARIYDDLSLRECYSALPNASQRRLNLQYLQDRGTQFDSFRRKGLSRFLRFIDELIDRGEDLGQPSALPEGADVVRVMTMHKSKGLQFPVVVVPFLGKKFNMGDAREQVMWDRNAGMALRFLPGAGYGSELRSIAPELVKPAIEQRVRSEELRLLYVALTRAQQRIVMTASLAGATEKLQEIAGQPPAKGREAARAMARAGTHAAMLLTALRGRPELNQSSRPGSSLRIEVRRPGAPGADPSMPAGDVAAHQQTTLQSQLPLIRSTLERVATHWSRPPGAAIRAKFSVTEAKRAHEALHHEENPAARRPRPVSQDSVELPSWWPDSLSGEQPAGPRQTGTLTHRLIALLDLNAMAMGRSVGEELERLTEAGFFTADEAGSIYVPAVQRFFEDPIVGQRVLEHRATVRREVPFTISIEPGRLFEGAGYDGPPIVFQGVVDLVFLDRNRRTGKQVFVLVDFKTDWCGEGGELLLPLEQHYAPQMMLYQAGIERALGRRVDETFLYFLRADQPVEIEPLDREGKWLEFLRTAATTV